MDYLVSSIFLRATGRCGSPQFHRVSSSDEVGEYSSARATVKGWRGTFSSPSLAEHLGRQKVDFLGGRRLSRRRLTALGATTPDAAALAQKRAERLPSDVTDRAGDEGEDEEVLEPDGHRSSEKLGQ